MCTGSKCSCLEDPTLLVPEEPSCGILVLVPEELPEVHVLLSERDDGGVVPRVEGAPHNRVCRGLHHPAQPTGGGDTA